MRAARDRSEDGFGLIELLIAMLVMALGIMAIVAGFSSGMVALSNASRTGTAGTLADKQMEAYRALPYSSIRLRSTPTPATPTRPTRGDPAYDSRTRLPHRRNVVPSSTPTCTPVQTQASGLTGARRPELSPRHVHRLELPASATLTGDVRVAACSGGGARPVKKVTVVVRDGATPSKTYVRETSTFDAAT